MSHTPAPGASAAQDATDAQAFIAKWSGITASELATAQSFVIEHCALLGVEPPSHEPHYQFERPITFRHGDGSSSAGQVDCYKRGHFAWESKKLKAGIVAQASGVAPGKALTMPCSKPASRTRTMPAPCPPPRAARRLWWWSMSAT